MVPEIKPVGEAVTVVSSALVMANGVPSIAVKVSNDEDVEYTNPFRELLAPALTTDVNFTEVSVIRVAVSEMIKGIAELMRPVMIFPRVLPDALVASNRM